MLAFVLAHWHNHKIPQLLSDLQGVTNLVHGGPMLRSLVYNDGFAALEGLSKHARWVDWDVDHLSILASCIQRETLLPDKKTLLQ